MGRLEILTAERFNELRDAIAELTGIVFESRDLELVQRRLGPLLVEHGFDYPELVRQLRRGTQLVRSGVVDAITTRETHWFRDVGFRESLEFLLERAAEEARAASAGRVRIWSAASSSGQEAYSIAILLHELSEADRLAGLSPSAFEIQGTDISPAALSSAREGLYGAVAMGRGMPPQLAERYFDREGENLRLKARVRALCNFRELNLVRMNGAAEGWDIVLLRNVLIYFTSEDRARVLENLARKLRPGGVLVVGGSEDPARYTDVFERRTDGPHPYFTPRG